MIQEFFTNYINEIYFIYGLSFFVMGIAIAFQVRRNSSFTMAKSLWLLAAFGFIHGISEWAYFYIPYKAPIRPSDLFFTLKMIELSLIGISFVLLLFFGIKLLYDIKKKVYFKYVFGLAIILTFFWLSYFVFFRLIIVREDVKYWATLANIFSRYFFGLPGGLLSAYAVYLQKGQIKYFGGTAVLLSINILVISFMGYAIFAGAIVPTANYFPASFLNTNNFFNWTTIPIALVRTFFSLLITFSMLKVLKLFQIEKTAFINQVVGENAVLMERERIKRDLHDGIIQSLYALGLNMKDIEYFIEEDNIGEAKLKITNSIENVDNTIRDLRMYIQDLKRAELAGLSLDQLIDKLEKRFNERFDIEVVVDNRLKANINVTPEIKIHLYHILNELLANVIKHANASRVELKLLPDGENIEIIVEDNGIGFEEKEFKQGEYMQGRWGIVNIQERVHSMGGYFNIKSNKGIGSRIIVEIPLKEEVDGAKKSIDSR